jgi:Protein of unknown function (DUF2950)
VEVAELLHGAVEVVAPVGVAGAGEEAEPMSKRTSIRRLVTFAASAAMIGAAPVCAAFAAQQTTQLSYATPDEAAAALAAATHSHDLAALRSVLGPDSGKLLSSGDRYADKEREARFAAAYDEKHTLVPQGTDRVVLDVGNDDWPLPIPIVRVDGRWQFDTKEGAEEIINRRIGRNELAAIRVALTYVDAQKDYFNHMKQQTGTGYYAERLVSTQGRQDGLYWPATTGNAESPFGPLVAQAQEEGYPGELVGGKPIPYQGYYFHVLKAQGSNAPGGAMSYVQSGRLTGGFALIAWPATYASSGIMTFEVNQDGTVFQKDLGTNTAHVAAAVTRFDPDLTWARVELTNQ